MAADLTTLFRLANDAKATVELPGFQRAWAKLYGDALDRFLRSAPLEGSVREEAYWELRTLEKLDAEFKTAIQAPLREGKRQDRQR